MAVQDRLQPLRASAAEPEQPQWPGPGGSWGTHPGVTALQPKALCSRGLWGVCPRCEAAKK